MVIVYLRQNPPAIVPALMDQATKIPVNPHFSPDSTAATDLGMSTALRFVGLLDVLSSMSILCLNFILETSWLPAPDSALRLKIRNQTAA